MSRYKSTKKLSELSLQDIINEMGKPWRNESGGRNKLKDDRDHIMFQDFATLKFSKRTI